MSEFPACRFGDLFAIPLRNGLNKPSKVRGVGIKMINMGELFAHSRIDDIDMERVPVSETETAIAFLEAGDLLFARQSLVFSGAGKCSIFTGANEPITFEGHIIRVRLDKSRCEPFYYYYLFNSPAGRQIIESIILQVAAAGIRGSDLANLVVPCPQLSVQREIVHILGSLDDKIDLNRRMNATLESMARALFKSFFVDFDPVRAKTEGRQPDGIDADTAALFPGSFEDSDLGPIPAGWEAVRVFDVCEAITSGGTPSTTRPDYWNGHLPWLSSGETRNRFVVGTEKTITERGVRESSTRLVRSGTTVIASAGQGHTRGQTSLLAIDSYINQSVVALIADKAKVSPLYLFFDLSGRYEEMRRISDSSSSRGSLTTKLLGGMGILKPNSEVICAFDQAVAPLVDRIVNNQRQSETIAATRDALLPRLMSGETRV